MLRRGELLPYLMYCDSGPIWPGSTWTNRNTTHDPFNGLTAEQWVKETLQWMDDFEKSKSPEQRDLELFLKMNKSTWDELQRDIEIFNRTKKASKLMKDANFFLALGKHYRKENEDFLRNLLSPHCGEEGKRGEEEKSEAG